MTRRLNQALRPGKIVGLVGKPPFSRTFHTDRIYTPFIKNHFDYTEQNKNIEIFIERYATNDVLILVCFTNTSCKINISVFQLLGSRLRGGEW